MPRAASHAGDGPILTSATAAAYRGQRSTSSIVTRSGSCDPTYRYGVLINDVDRLSRDIANLAVVKRDLEAKGVDVIFKNLPSDRSPLSNFMVNILGSFASSSGL